MVFTSFKRHLRPLFDMAQRRKRKDRTLQKRVVGCLLQHPWNEAGYDQSNVGGEFYFSEEHQHLLLTNRDGELDYNDKRMRTAR